MTHITGTASSEAALALCARDPDIRILRRVSSLDDFPLADGGGGPIRTVALIDTETTGTDPDRDEVIDVAVVILEVDAEGEIVGIGRAGQALRDPSFPIPEAISRLTGITDADVQGKAIDLDRLARLIGGADVRIAHNAQFDLAFLEHLMPSLVGAAWACSARDFDWPAAGFDGASPGCLRRHWHYIAREAAVTLDSEGRPILLSNLGDTIEEIGDGLVVQEQVLRAMRKNAKLGFRMIGAFPYGFSPDARREALERIGEALFGARGLPWTAAAHDADPEAVADNPHFHLDYGLMPMERQADGSYLVANELRTDLDGPEGLRFVRHMMAQILTEVAQEQGLDRTFTALSYRDRGMDREGGEHVGQEATAAGRQGEHVAAIARNEARRRRDDALERAREARKRLDALEQLKRAIEREAADVPGIPDVPSFEAEAIPIPARQLVDGPHLTDSAMAVPPPAMPISDLALVDLPADSPPGIGQLPSGLVHLPDPAIAMLPTPELSVIPHVARSGVAPPTVTSIGPEAPGIPNVPSLAAIGHAGPIVLPAPSLAAIVEAAPEGLMPPVLADIGEADAMSMPAPPRMAAMGKLPPTIPAQHFQLWDIGREVARDEDDDRVEAELRRAVEREALRRREVAAAKPLNPFGDHAGNRVDPEFAQLLALIEKEPGLLTVHEGQVFPGDALPAHLRRALHGYALHPRARATLVNAARNARHSVSGNALARPSSPTAVRVASAQAARDTWER